ncbi:SsgA family sporulation/cell division regulator [Kitasatospora sp. NPDC094011]|uniref:SsgA family sporulation/cell division regulator n=1 Tax=Kitasatospora sp. NPDC094011 TaxID=3364090 RepID=UPI0038057362
MTTHTVELELLPDPDEPGRPPAVLRGTFLYCTRRPFEVTLVLLEGCHPKPRWTFARDLLLDGVRQPAGEGEVRVRLTRRSGRTARVELILVSGGWCSVFSLGLIDLVQFLIPTMDLVPPGEEMRVLDLDDGLARLLNR